MSYNKVLTVLVKGDANKHVSEHQFPELQSLLDDGYDIHEVHQSV